MENLELYNAASYASPFAPGKSIFPEQRRIFHRADCIYTPILSIEELSPITSGLKLKLKARGGLKSYLTLQVLAADKLRLSLSLDECAELNKPYFVTEELSSYPHTKLREGTNAAQLHWDDYVLTIQRQPFHLSLSKKTQVLWELDQEQIAGDQRWVYLPQGSWRSLENPEQQWNGGRYIQLATPLHYLPVFLRTESISPMWEEAPQDLKSVIMESLS